MPVTGVPVSRPHAISPAFAVAVLLAMALIVLAQPALAQIARHPFAIGANEGGVGHQNGLGAFILAQESRFYLGLTSAVRAVKGSAGGLWLLIGLSFAYGVFHAAGPGHGKAVITSYMVSNEIALRRGFLISLAAALLQGLVATALVGLAAFVFDATAPRMTAAAEVVELASYLGIVALGLVLVWRKGRAVLATLRPAAAPMPLGLAAAGPVRISLRAPASPSRFFADDGSEPRHGPDCDCGHTHMPDPTMFTDRRFDWKAAGMAVVTAGARPCSGAILVLVFSLSQGLFLAGVAATLAMSLGTAVTTGALAAVAVFAKDVALKLAGGRSGRRIMGRLVEFCAAACVLAFGVALLAATLGGVYSGG